MADVHLYYVKVDPCVHPAGYMLVWGDKPWVSGSGTLTIGNDPTPVVVPADYWFVVYAVDSDTHQPINVLLTPEKAG